MSNQGQPSKSVTTVSTAKLNACTTVQEKVVSRFSSALAVIVDVAERARSIFRQDKKAAEPENVGQEVPKKVRERSKSLPPVLRHDQQVTEMDKVTASMRALW